MTSDEQPIVNGVPIPHDVPIAELQAIIATLGSKAWPAIRALAERPEIEALSALIVLSQSNDPNLRRVAVEGVGIHQSGFTASDTICKALQDRDGYVVRAATKAAAIHGLHFVHKRILSLERLHK